MKAKVYQRKDRKGTRFYIYLYWKGQKKKRYHDIDGQPFKAEYRAERMAERINSEIETEGKNFNLSKWFGATSNALAFDNYVEAWLDRRRSAGEVTANYLRDVSTIAEKYWIPFFGQQDLREIRAGHLEDLLASFPEHLGPRARQYYLSTLKTMFTSAYRREEINRVPPFPKVTVPEKEIEWLTSEEQALVLAEMSPANRPIFELMMFYGCRPSEARALQWDCVDFNRQEIIFRRSLNDNDLRETTKNNRVKALPLVPEMAELLNSIRGIGGYVFRARSGRPYTKNWLMKIWRVANKKAHAKHGTPIVTAYQGCKHSRGMDLIAKGFGIEGVRALFGQETYYAARRYARHTTATLREKLGALSSGGAVGEH